MPVLDGFRLMGGEGCGELDGGRGIDRGHMKVYSGSRPLSGESLHPDSNLVYEHNGVTGSYRKHVELCCV
jgi:hypothetical protein